MSFLKVDAGKVSSANDSFKTEVINFNQMSIGNELNASCSDGEVDQLLKKNANDIQEGLSELMTKLEKYGSIIETALGYIREADAGFPETNFDITIPSGLAGVSSYIGLSVPWYKDIKGNSIGNIYNDLKGHLIGFLPNFVSNGNPQGLTEFDHYVVGTNSSGTMYIYDKDTGKTKVVPIGSDYHLGGISYHNGSLYVATNETVSKYNFNDLLTKDIREITPVQFNSQQTQNNHSSQVSFLTTTNDGRLITGQFHHTGNDKYASRGGDCSDLLIYNIQGNGLSQPTTITVPDNMTRIQGACVYQKNGQDYYLLTSSYGTSDSAKSQLYVATLGSDGHTLVKQNQLTLPAGAEQVTVTTDGNIAVMYEGHSSGRNITVLNPDTIIV